MTIRTVLLTAASAAALTGVATAQEERRSVVDALTDEIVVTATKSNNPENVQDVPIAMTAYGEETLEALKVRTVEDLSFNAPNVSLDDIGTSRGTANFAIRGLGVNSSIPSIDPAVGVFVDGVYLGLNTGVVFDVFDLESIEVLRGPQGLLFGRNTTGGAILLNTGNPTDEFTYKARAAIEGPTDDDRGGLNKFVMGTVSGPIVPGTLNGKVSAYFNQDDGYFRNLFDGSDFGEAETVIIRGALEFMPSENLNILAKIERFDSDGDGPAAQNRGIFQRDSFDFSVDTRGFYESENWNGSLRADLDVPFGDGTITNIFGYRDAEGATNGDIDSSPVDLFTSTTALSQEQISNELRYAGTFGKAQVTTGLFYFEQDVAYDETRDLLNATGPTAPPVFYGGGGQNHEVLGVFGQVDYALTENLTATAGLRWSREEKDAFVTYIQPRPPCSVVEGTCPQDGTNPFTGAPDGYTDDNTWENVTPKFGLTYESGGQLAYAQYTKGFRSGGYNFRITDVGVFLTDVLEAQNGAFSFDEEEVDAFEIGAKLQSEDRRKIVNVALFRTEIDNMQREVNLSDPGAAVVQNITNTADATIHGLEVDGQFVIGESLVLTGNIGIIDAEYDTVRFDLTGDGLVTTADENLAIPRVPEMTYGLGLVHELGLADAGAVVTTVNFQHRDEFAYTDNNFGWIQEADMLMANVSWETPIEGVSVSIYGDNLLDEVQAGGDTQLPFGGPLSNGVNAPFDQFPAAGTLSPLKKGRLVGIELRIEG